MKFTKNLEEYVKLEFERTRLLNETEIDIDSKEWNDFEEEVYDSISKLTSEDVIDIDRNLIDEILKKNKLSFGDKRCYSYLYDAIEDMIKYIY